MVAASSSASTTSPARSEQVTPPGVAPYLDRPAHQRWSSASPVRIGDDVAGTVVDGDPRTHQPIPPSPRSGSTSVIVSSSMAPPLDARRGVRIPSVRGRTSSTTRPRFAYRYPCDRHRAPTVRNLATEDSQRAVLVGARCCLRLANEPTPVLPVVGLPSSPRTKAPASDRSSNRPAESAACSRPTTGGPESSVWRSITSMCVVAARVRHELVDLGFECRDAPDPTRSLIIVSDRDHLVADPDLQPAEVKDLDPNPGDKRRARSPRSCRCDRSRACSCPLIGRSPCRRSAPSPARRHERQCRQRFESPSPDPRCKGRPVVDEPCVRLTTSSWNAPS